MANLQKLNPTQQELYNYLEQQTGQVNFEVLQPFTTQEMGAVLHISRNTVSQYLNEFFKEGWMVKINTRPVYYFLRETLSRKFNVQTLDSEYEDLQFLQQDLNHGRRADSCFAGVIGYHLSLKSAVEKCRVAVEYPPTGLPLVLAGGKRPGHTAGAGGRKRHRQASAGRQDMGVCKGKAGRAGREPFCRVGLRHVGRSRAGRHRLCRFVQTQAGGWHRQRFFVPARL